MQDLIRRITVGRTPKIHKIALTPGDTVEVSVRVKEGEKERIQKYKGLVIKVQGSGITRAFTVRKISSGVGVERTFPFSSPAIDNIQLIARGQVRRAKLYYIRNLEGKKARISGELVSSNEAASSKEAFEKKESAN
ncbi:MAG: 50S ribosomal protein L19 [Bdellovibrionales bacterium CG10_big_fil_rev_8_21_14_0_10_45_34]|nr:MAG: 50S ribosomal protein L19 [Bdellovibrionales bacterium CG10_big_fil_rev_8_21_14_0_10_45_34]